MQKPAPQDRLSYCILWFFFFGGKEFAVASFVLFNAIANQNQDLTVCRTPFIIGHNVQFVQHFLVNTDR